MSNPIVKLAVAFALIGSAAQGAFAMPWDLDMYRQQNLTKGEIARAPAKGTVPVGYRPWKLTTEEASAKLKNPIPASPDSIQLGKRLWSANCLPCHGETGKGGAPVTKLIGAPDISTDFYKGKPDGSIYGILMNGGSNMPRYGYKFSENERWHIVNYVRYLQGVK